MGTSLAAPMDTPEVTVVFVVLPTASRTPTLVPTRAPSLTPTPTRILTEEPTKRPYVFDPPIYIPSQPIPKAK